MNLLRTRSLTIDIGTIQICKDFNFTLASGEYWGVLGSNGIGKTTLLHSLAGLREISSGEIDIADKKLSEWNSKKLAQKLGVLFQDSFDSFPSTVIETAMIGRYPYLSFLGIESKYDIELTEQALVDVSLDAMSLRQVDTLSGGERRRLAIATLLVQNPILWLLDEPTNHLDLHHQVSLLKLILDRVKLLEGGLMMVLHDVNLLTRFCTHAVLMIAPDKVICGPIDEVVNKANLEALYQHKVREITENGTKFYFPE